MRYRSKRRGNFVGVDKFNLTTADKESLVPPRPLGCEKTTTMRKIARLEDVIVGDILVDGKRVSDQESKP